MRLKLTLALVATLALSLQAQAGSLLSFRPKSAHMVTQAEIDEDVAAETRGEMPDVKPGRQLRVSVFGLLNPTIDVMRGIEERELSFGAGALVETPYYRKISVETGAFYQNRSYRTTEQNTKLIQDSRRLHIPVLVRYTLLDYLSVGVGPYMGVQLGTARTTQAAGPVAASGVRTSADDDLEFGIDAAATFMYPIGPKARAFVEGRYSFLFGKETGEEADTFSGLAGIKFDFET